MEHEAETGRLEPHEALAAHTAPARWTLKRLVEWIEGTFERRVSRETVRRALKRLGFSWKKAKGVLNRDSTAAREAFVERLPEILQRTLGPQAPG